MSTPYLRPCCVHYARTMPSPPKRRWGRGNHSNPCRSKANVRSQYADPSSFRISCTPADSRPKVVARRRISCNRSPCRMSCKLELCTFPLSTYRYAEPSRRVRRPCYANERIKHHCKQEQNPVAIALWHNLNKHPCYCPCNHLIALHASVEKATGPRLCAAGLHLSMPAQVSRLSYPVAVLFIVPSIFFESSYRVHRVSALAPKIVALSLHFLSAA